MNPHFAEHEEGSADRGPYITPDATSGPHKTLFAYSIDKVERRVWVKFTGKLTFNVIAMYADHLTADRRFDPGYAELVDLRLVETVALSAEELMKLADKIDPFDLSSKRAFVAQSNDQIRAARIHQLLRPGNRNMRIFISLREAKQWLGCD